MGTWDASAFGNDDAVDYLCEFEEAHTIAKAGRILEIALDAVLDGDDYIEASEGAVGIAAAALVVTWQEPAMLGGETMKLLSPWPRTNDPLPAYLKIKASGVLDRMQDALENELADLWEETEDFSEFNAELVR